MQPTVDTCISGLPPGTDVKDKGLVSVIPYATCNNTVCHFT